jgi:hypothetical protein
MNLVLRARESAWRSHRVYPNLWPDCIARDARAARRADCFLPSMSFRATALFMGRLVDGRFASLLCRFRCPQASCCGLRPEGRPRGQGLEIDQDLRHHDHRLAWLCRTGSQSREWRSSRWSRPDRTGNPSSTSWSRGSRSSWSTPITSNRFRAARPTSRTANGSLNCFNMDCCGPVSSRLGRREISGI